MPAAYVVKTVAEGQPFPGVFGELKAGRARIGWSYQDNLDLRLLLGRIEQGEQLNEDERDACNASGCPLFTDKRLQVSLEQGSSESAHRA